MSLECFFAICTFEFVHIHHFQEGIASRNEELDGENWFSLRIDGIGRSFESYSE